jgi:hypothetical protein
MHNARPKHDLLFCVNKHVFESFRVESRAIEESSLYPVSAASSSCFDKLLNEPDGSPFTDESAVSTESRAKQWFTYAAAFLLAFSRGHNKHDQICS